MRVECYRNLHTGNISVRECGGKVLAHESVVYVYAPRFVVQPAGHAKVIEEQRKNVHAFVRGQLMGFTLGTLANFVGWEHWNLATYNPYKMPSFYDKTTLDPVDVAEYAVVTTSGVYYA
jgi:hypothetical protein